MRTCARRGSTRPRRSPKPRSCWSSGRFDAKRYPGEGRGPYDFNIDASLCWHDGVAVHPLIQHAPDPDYPGWWTWDVAGAERYNATIGKLLVRAEGPRRARCRAFPGSRQGNLADFVHGGAILTFIDIAMFAGGKLAGISDTAHAVTLDLSCQFIGAGRLHVPLECSVELLRETGRLAFLRGLVEQEQGTVAAWSGTLRKGGERR